jgi:hypothetical protein
MNEIVYGKENKFCTGPTRAAEEGQKSLVPAQRAPQTSQGRDPFHMYPLSPYLPQFQQSAGATPL